MSDDDSSPNAKPEAPTYALSRSVPLDLIDMAAQIQQADQMLGAVTHNKLRVIADQIRLLQEKAREVLEEAKSASDLHRAQCRFRKRPGHVYHLYRRPEGTPYFSMLSPRDWRDAPPDPFLGSFRLEPDMSWTALEAIDERDAQDDVLDRLLTTATGSGHDSDD